MSILTLPVLSTGRAPSVRGIVVDGGGSTAIPVNEAGIPPKYVYLQVAPNDALAAFGDAIVISPETGAVAALETTGIPIPLGGPGIVLNVAGFSHIGHRIVVFSTTASVALYITPLENQ